MRLLQMKQSLEMNRRGYMGTEEKVNPPKLGVNKDETVDKIGI